MLSLPDELSKSAYSASLFDGNPVARSAAEGALASEDVDDADYSQVPVEQFGLALLKGMGLKEDDIEKSTSR